MVLSTFVEGFAASQPTKRQYGHRCSAPPQRVDMYPWAGPDPNSLPPDQDRQSVQQDHGPVVDDVDEPSRSPRYPAVGGPGAGDFAGDGLQVVRTRFSRSSSSLEQVPEEMSVGFCQDSASMPASTCSVRRARYMPSFSII